MPASILKQYESEEAYPKPKATLNSYRSFGYSLQTAIADIIDNSISAYARNVWINYIWKGRDSYLTILDDGVGMDKAGLIDAMTPGSKDPVDEREIHDLGRFGLGLKTASFSQCTRLTVASKIENGKIFKRCWDLQHVNSTGKWILLDYISDSSLLLKLETFKSGTLVIWELLDTLVGNSTVENESIRNVFLEEFNILESHLGMIFQRFLEGRSGRKLNIFVNDEAIKSWDPFLLAYKPQLAITEHFSSSKTEINAFVMPHLSKFKTESERDIAGGPKGWYDQQGFYIYRNNRLLVAGDWLGLFPRNDHSKLARISIDLNNTEDKNWNLDIKKSRAKPPAILKKEIERIGKATRKISGSIYSHRGTILKRNPDTPDENFEKIWNVIENRDGSIDYKINRNHRLTKKLFESNNGDAERLLSILEDNIPIETIIYYHNEDPGYHENRSSGKELNEGIVMLATEIFKSLRSQGIKKDLALKQLFNIEPFNHYPQLTAYFE